MRWGFKSCHFVNAVYAECLLWFFFERWSHSVPDGFLVFFEVFYMFLNGLFWMFLGMKMSTIFCFPTALTVYGVDFLILDLDGFKTGNHSGLFWKIPCQKVGCSTQILCNHQISCFKAMLDIFLVKKNDLLKWFFLAILYLRMNFFELHFPIFLIFWGSSCGCSWCWPFLETCLDMFHGHNIHFVGRGKKVVSIFYKKEVLFFKKEKKRENTKKREKKPKVSFLESYTHSILKIDLIIIKS